jgi:hypothetical protein
VSSNEGGLRAPTREIVDYLLSPRAIRERAARIHGLAEAGGTHFRPRPEKLAEVADFVLEVTRANYPDLKIPFHSRWGHFKAAGVDRLARLEERLVALPPAERARAKLDLAIVSVLLDAGSGPGWKYRENATEIARSEGLAVASFHMFMEGAFSSDPKRPLRADARGLKALSTERLLAGFQVSESNPLVGTEGRLGLLRALASAVEADPKRFPGARPGGIHDWAIAEAGASRRLPAPRLLDAVLRGLGPIWPGRIRLEGTELGDVWPHPALGPQGSPDALVPFHKLSQWLTYSLIEPLEEAGLTVDAVDELTGLAEYRNGGLILDRGLVELRDPALARKSHRPDSELVIEWRALTVHYLDRIAERVRASLGRKPEEFPLARVLEGGTWWAGRKAAAALRPGGGPPLTIESDGTVF